MIVPQSMNNNIGNVLVSLNSISEAFVYKKVINKRVKETIDWFYERNEYTPRQILRGLKIELTTIENDIGLRYTGNYREYNKVLQMALDIVLTDFPIEKYPEVYI